MGRPCAWSVRGGERALPYDHCAPHSRRMTRPTRNGSASSTSRPWRSITSSSCVPPLRGSCSVTMSPAKVRTASEECWVLYVINECWSSGMGCVFQEKSESSGGNEHRSLTGVLCELGLCMLSGCVGRLSDEYVCLHGSGHHYGGFRVETSNPKP